MSGAIAAALIVPAGVETAADTLSAGAQWREPSRSAARYAPYLARLMARAPGDLAAIAAEGPEAIADAAILDARRMAAAPPTLEEGMQALREAKRALHLSAAIADLARAWPLTQTTGRITAFADASLQAALALAARTMHEKDEIEAAAFDGPHGPIPGITFIAMGKMGAGELNYSSDVDFSVFYDPARLPLKNARDARSAALRVVQLVVKAMEEMTPDGYVFRTDLRLRPDPASTPPAVTIAAAEIYYQSVGQNWERAAFIKARPAAGDIPLGRAFLKTLEPYIWRRHLDYAAVADVHSIKRQIMSAHGSADLGDPIFDVKLGRGGIRDIELHVQTQQLILGGRNPALRAPATLHALAALTQANVMDADARDELSEAYDFFRHVEHRIQMLEDEQTHKVPADGEKRARVAALCGFADMSAWERALLARRAAVAEIDHQLFGRFDTLAASEGSLIFTGVEDNPETIATLTKMGFADPSFVAGAIRGWHHGRIRAMRSERARELLTALTPKILAAMAKTGAPDQAFHRFADFFAGLPAGVQVLSLFEAQPKFLEEIVSALALAPRLADALARRPALIDSMIEPRFERPLDQDDEDERRGFVLDGVAEAGSFEAAINAARRIKREEAFRYGMQVLNGRASAEAAGRAYSHLAECMIEALAQSALQEVERQHGRQPGAFAVLALGKFGGRELSENSDLDIMVVYDAAEDARSGGDRALSPIDFYARLTQRLISALSAPTEEGQLYDVDMKLRPSGAKGPVAVRLSTFERYYSDEAWTWELLALTRLRPVAGDGALGARVLAAAHGVLSRERDAAKVLADTAEMRALMDRERKGKGAWDLKLAPGGFVDIEFIVQSAQLIAAHARGDVLQPNTGAALDALEGARMLDPALARTLREGWSRLSRLQQVLRICVEGEFDPASAPDKLKELLARVGGAADFAALGAQLEEAEAGVRAAFGAWTGSPATEVRA
ncbi:MAG: bifunctional [glutamine synthetase] adenylyltransferase/[glutamine synthetase]-adenylyl-L-tyrosine phosphorylase [Hyphomonadaceae bacterium]